MRSGNQFICYRYTCIMCNESFEQSSQLNEHMSQCPMAPGASQGAPSDPSTSDQFVSPPASAESEEQPGFSGDLVPPTTSSAPNWSFPPGDGAPPSGVPVSGASQFYSQQSPSFGNTSQSPRTSGPGSSRVSTCFSFDLACDGRMKTQVSGKLRQCCNLLEHESDISGLHDVKSNFPKQSELVRNV